MAEQVGTLDTEAMIKKMLPQQVNNDDKIKRMLGIE